MPAMIQLTDAKNQTFTLLLKDVIREQIFCHGWIMEIKGRSSKVTN
jgi:hypothetical protein